MKRQIPAFVENQRRRPSRLKRAGRVWRTLGGILSNSRFLADLAEWKELVPEKVNPRGGSIAIGHPLGASDVRILGGLAHELKRRDGGFGVATMCIGVGQGLAMVLEGRDV